MEWIYISPHLDDAALSCGGLIREQTQAGERVGIWTICAGDPPERLLSDFAESLHARWQVGGEAITKRRSEDLASCAQIGAYPRHFQYPDCIYRGVARIPNEPQGEPMGDKPGEIAFFYASLEAIFGPIHEAEVGLVEQLSQELAEELPQEIELVCPLALGGHVDHRLTRAAVEKLGGRLWYYADYPYAVSNLEEIEALEKSGWTKCLFPVSRQGMEAWKGAVEAHQSQISTFWPNLEAMREELEGYRECFGGAVLWRPA